MTALGDGGSPVTEPLRRARLWRFGAAAFDEAALVLSVAGKPVPLERRPLELLALLLRHPGEVVTKDEIQDALWPDRIVTEASVTKCVARLRQALGDGEQKLIRTIHGYGYRLTAEIACEERRRVEAAPLGFEFRPGQALPHRPNWRLVERLGTGGYGDAWLGEHAKTHERRVFKFAQDGAGVAALRREITLSRLLRDGLGARDDLVRILDWNLEEAPCFVETEWSAEGNLADWAARQGGAAALPLALRLELVAQVAEALAAAHSMGALHKDLKPANVLIHLDAGGQPRIRLADFGSGRVLDPSRLDDFGITRAGFEAEAGMEDTTSGTLLYRAPELIGGNAPTVQADLYALGVLLYQMAVGDLRRVLAPGWELEIEDPLLREDIGAAAAGDPARRLGDAAEFARRLRSLETRWAERQRLAGVAAEAERARRALDLARARRAPLLLLVAALTIGLGLSLWQARRAETASKLAQRETARAQAVTKFLTDDLLSAANPFLSADPNIPVKDLLATATGDLDHRFAPGTLDRAAIEEAIGKAYAGLSDGAHARPLLDSALATRRRVLGDADPQTQAVRVAIAQLDERDVDLKGLKAIGQAILDAGSLDAETTLRGRYAVALADCQAVGTDANCAEPLRALFAEARSRLGPRHDFTLGVESMLAYTLGTAQLFDEGIRLGREALAETEAAYGPDHPQALDRKFKLAETLSDAGQPEEAIALLTEVRAKLLALSGGENEAAIRAANELGKAYADAKRYDEALATFQLALDYHVKTRGESFTLSRMGLNNIANTLAFMGRVSEAIPMQQKALDLQRSSVGADHPDTLWLENNLANFYDRNGDLAKAEATYRDTIERGRRQFTKGEWDLGHFLFRLGQVLAKEGRTAEARTAIEEGLAILQASLGPDHARTQRAQAALAALAQP